MDVAIVTDSGCDLPRSYWKEHGIELIPVDLLFGDERHSDRRDPKETVRFYRHYLDNKDINAETEAPSPETIEKFFLDRLVRDYDRAVLITLASSRSPLFDNVQAASKGILENYRQAREEAGREGSFSFRVIDSRSVFTGQALLVFEAVRLLEEEKLPFEQLRERLEGFRKSIQAYMLPDDLYYMYNRGRKKGEKSVGWFGFRMGSALDMKPLVRMQDGETEVERKIQGFDTALAVMLDQTGDAIRNGLRTNTICMSYAGNPEELKKHPRYKAFARTAERAGVRLLLSVMSITAGINVGPGAVSIAYAAK